MGTASFYGQNATATYKTGLTGNLFTKERCSDRYLYIY